VAEQFAAVPWREAMATLAELALPYVHRFQALLDVAPPEDMPLVRFMVDHEQLVVRIAGREAAGESAMASELVVRLAHPYPPRSPFSDVQSNRRQPEAAQGFPREAGVENIGDIAHRARAQQNSIACS